MTSQGNSDRSALDYALGIGIAVGAGLGILFGLWLGNIVMGTVGVVVAVCLWDWPSRLERPLRT
jgi:hypothetical protein